MPATVGGLRSPDLFHRESAHRLLRGASAPRFRWRTRVLVDLLE